MTKFVAIDAMKAGHKVRHKYFSSEEWISIDSQGNYLFEDGVVCSPALFWMDRYSDDWNNNWEIVE